jgi:hypothetical protein
MAKRIIELSTEPAFLLTTARAPFDGALVGTIKVMGDGGRGSVHGKLFRDVPVEMYASVHGYHPSDANVRHNSFTLPLCAGDEYQYNFEANAGDRLEIKFFMIET